MRINIAASHRFHMLDLARELANQGHDVRFYSYVPTRRAIKFGLPKKNSYSLFFIVLPFLFLVKITKQSNWSLKLINNILDQILCHFMKPCDIYIALGTIYSKSIEVSKQKYSCITILEWGSKHIEEQQKILSCQKNFKKQSDYFIKRTIASYYEADYIAIPSLHVKDSFIKRGVSESKLLVNPYGVDLNMFKPTKLENRDNGHDTYDMIMVGGWSYRKGCDLLIEVCKKTNYKLLHVGSLKDLEFPNLPNMTHIPPVEQVNLMKYYAKAKIFILPSREEGLALVQAQAIACGLPIVCSKNTGGIDLKSMLREKKWIIEFQSYEMDDIIQCVSQALELASLQKGQRSYNDDFSEKISWEAYGKRYNDNIIYISKD